MTFWDQKKNILAFNNAPKNVVVELIKSKYSRYPGYAIAELLERKKFETFWIQFGLEHKGSATKVSRKGNNCLQILIARSQKAECRSELVELLLKKGVSPNQLNKKGFSAFHVLCKQLTKQPFKLFELFFKYGADPNLYCTSRQLTSRTPFALVLQNELYNDLELFQLFFENNADPDRSINQISSEMAVPLLFTRDVLPRRSILQLFVDHGSPVTAELGETPLLTFLIHKNLDQDYLEFFLKNGCQINPEFVIFTETSQQIRYYYP
ncbi:ankyrin repeat-containing protein [Anaeramoeba flamelloides]|uniref:Ankyrin repeat-containing protein n=1 Tax=Anaeramoeba flamelloides TaxID=1746091 RepID=A0ABQ8ZBX1_9EUKA|nr:ankyrin repeat-containing protein [Anaeramoeba flamelloides]